MGVFDDKKFERLDWVSQITETIESNLNGLLARLPERLELDINLITSLIKECSSYNSSFNLTVGNVVRKLIVDMEVTGLEYSYYGVIEDCFKFEMSPDFTVDFESNSITGTLILVKTTSTLEDNTLQDMMGDAGLSCLKYTAYDSRHIGRINEIIDLIGGLEEQRANRSTRKKIKAISIRLKNIFKNNEWRIRDMELANKIPRWIREYILYGNLASYANFCKVKVMTHQNMPIYSIEEE